MTDSKEQPVATPRVSALHQLREGFRPSRNLWPEIENRIASTPSASQSSATISTGSRRWPPGWVRLAAAAVVLPAVGLWIGHVERTLSLVRKASEAAASLPIPADVCVSEALYQRERTALMSAPAGTLAGLPPDSRQRVLSSLATVHNAVQDIEAALARDSTNLLLQELLLTTCQDETRVLTEIQTAGSAERAGRGI
jgi:hypothetical protein